MARAFRIYAKGKEAEIIEFIETHTVWEVEKKFGYRWFTIKPWYDEHKGSDPLSLIETNPRNNLSPYQKFVSALFNHYDQLRTENEGLKKKLMEANRELDYLEKFLQEKGIAEWENLKELYEYCNTE